MEKETIDVEEVENIETSGKWNENQIWTSQSGVLIKTLSPLRSIMFQTQPSHLP